MAFEAKIIADSVCNEHRLTTMQVTHPRVVHSEFMTHCMFARNASSSRAIPFSKMVQKVLDDPFIPVRFGKNQKGMQAFEYLEGADRAKAVAAWLDARNNAVEVAKFMSMGICDTCHGTGRIDGAYLTFSDSKFMCSSCGGAGSGLGIHKQIVNRLIEPWSWITVCVTGDAGAWSNYFALRCHPDAADDIQKQAYMAQKAYFESTPITLNPGAWHTPYVLNAERVALSTSDLVKVSVGRCARTSYLTQEGKRDYAEDIALHDRLVTHKPIHASPLEHVCKAIGGAWRYGKYIGWMSYRYNLPNEYVTDFQPNYQEENHL